MDKPECQPTVRPALVADDERCSIPAAVDWGTSEDLINKYGTVTISHLHRWWKEVGVNALASQERLQNVAGTQLFLDFFASTGFGGPFVYKKRWYDSADGLPLDSVQPWAVRVPTFLRLWKAYLRYNGVAVPGKVSRPESSVFAFWCLCYRLPWPRARLQTIDSLVFGQQGKQLTSSALLKAVQPIPSEALQLED